MTQSYESKNTLRQFDLNLLPILRALLMTHSVARASELVGLSQSATSGALTRLRATFADPLLVQVGRNLVPTPRALELKNYLDKAFSELLELFEQRVFLPEKEERCFIISTSDFIVSELSIPLLKLMTAEAPGVSVRFVEISEKNAASMESGDIDFMVTPFTGTAHPADVQLLALSTDDMVIISSDRFPMPDLGLDLKTYLRSPHASYGVFDGTGTFEQRAVSAQGLVKRDLVIVPQFHLLPEFVQSIDCLAMMPRRIANHVKDKFGLRIWPVRFEMPKFELFLYWSLVVDRSPSHAWFRKLIIRALNQKWDGSTTRNE